MAFYPLWLLIIDWLLRLSVAALLIWRRRPVTASLAWLVVILFVPIFGLFFYLLIGESKLGSNRARKHERLTKGLESEALRLWAKRSVSTQDVELSFQHIAEFGLAVGGMPPLRGNKLTLFKDNADVLAGIVSDINAATDHIHMLFYIWMADKGSEVIADALISARKRGVTVRLLVDGVGSNRFLRGEQCRRLRDDGVQVVEALPARLWRIPLARVDLRNHRKIAVFDGRIAYCGSQNIHDKSFRASRWRETGEWIDATVRVEGPGAQALAVTFLRDWQLDSTEDITAVAPFLPETPIDPDSDCIVQVIPSGPGPTPTAIHQALLTTIYSAREEIIMTTPYFVPDEAMLEALRAAATRGVRVLLVVPEISDSPLVAAAARSHYLDMLESGVEIWQYAGGVLHAKTVTMDRRIALIGSTNMDQRSFFLNFEVTLFVYDDDFASILRFLQTDYLSSSSRIFVDEWRKRSALEIFRDNSAQLLGPLL